MPKRIRYKASKTAIDVRHSNADYKAVRGPVGSGKSVLCVQELLALASLQEPNEDGIRQSRWGVVRNTYPELLSTTIKTFQDWIPQSICPIVYSAPITGKLRIPKSDGTTIMAEFIFLALDRVDDISKLMSLEFTGIWINEAQFMHPEIVAEAYSRTGRYPSMRDGVGATWNGVILDTNAPDDSHWWYKYEQEIKPQGWDFFIQPGGLLNITGLKSTDYTPHIIACLADPERHKRVGERLYIEHPAAENVKNHKRGYGYWFKQIDETKDEGWIKSRICNEYALVKAGKPVYEQQFNFQWHVSEYELLPIKQHPIAMGIDFGLTPSVVIGQPMPNGQVRILDELTSEDMDLETFLDDCVIPHLAVKYPHHKLSDIPVWGDPSGIKRGDTNGDSNFDILIQKGFTKAEPIGDNNPVKRWDAVKHFLQRTVGAGKPAFLLSTHCHTLKKGFVSKYHFKRLSVAGSESVYREQADKNAFSHPHDALQYLCQGLRGNRVETTTKHYHRPTSTTTSAGY